MEEFTTGCNDRVNTVFCLALINTSKQLFKYKKRVKVIISKTKSLEQCERKKNPIYPNQMMEQKPKIKFAISGKI